jgi:hypothetical protein
VPTQVSLFLVGSRPNSLSLASRARSRPLQSIEVEPSTFNAAYLISKRDQGGHRLSTKTARVARVPPPQMPEVFQPVATLHNAKRFVYCASYFLVSHVICFVLPISCSDSVIRLLS